MEEAKEEEVPLEKGKGLTEQDPNLESLMEREAKNLETA